MIRRSGYVIIEGNIGVGKSTFAQALARAISTRDCVAEYIHEPDDSTNPFLDQYYADPAAFAYKMQMHLLHARFASTRYAQAAALADRGWYILDRSYYGDICFANVQARSGYFTPAECDSYMQAHRNMREFLETPTCAIFLSAPPAVCKRRIERRARPCETGEKPIPMEYLLALDGEIRKLESILDTRCRVLHLPWELDQTPEQVTAQADAVADRLLTYDNCDWDF